MEGEGGRQHDTFGTKEGDKQILVLGGRLRGLGAMRIVSYLQHEATTDFNQQNSVYKHCTDYRTWRARLRDRRKTKKLDPLKR